MCLSALNEKFIPKSGPVFDTSFEPLLMEKSVHKQEPPVSSPIAPVQTQEEQYETDPNRKSVDIDVDSLQTMIRLRVQVVQGSADHTQLSQTQRDKTGYLDESNDALTLEEQAFEQNQKKMLATVQGLMDLVRSVLAYRERQVQVYF